MLHETRDHLKLKQIETFPFYFAVRKSKLLDCSEWLCCALRQLVSGPPL